MPYSSVHIHSRHTTPVAFDAIYSCISILHAVATANLWLCVILQVELVHKCIDAVSMICCWCDAFGSNNRLFLGIPCHRLAQPLDLEQHPRVVSGHYQWAGFWLCQVQRFWFSASAVVAKGLYQLASQCTGVLSSSNHGIAI
ncbi:hypothetical protein U1Q18_038503 [Sarracenia purpurea var. burkii]